MLSDNKFNLIEKFIRAVLMRLTITAHKFYGNPRQLLMSQIGVRITTALGFTRHPAE